MPASGGYLATVSVKCGSPASSITLTVVATVIAVQCGLVFEIVELGGPHRPDLAHVARLPLGLLLRRPLELAGAEARRHLRRVARGEVVGDLERDRQRARAHVAGGVEQPDVARRLVVGQRRVGPVAEVLELLLGVELVLVVARVERVAERVADAEEVALEPTDAARRPGCPRSAAARAPTTTVSPAALRSPGRPDGRGRPARRRRRARCARAGCRISPDPWTRGTLSGHRAVRKDHTGGQSCRTTKGPGGDQTAGAPGRQLTVSSSTA